MLLAGAVLAILLAACGASEWMTNPNQTASVLGGTSTSVQGGADGSYQGTIEIIENVASQVTVFQQGTSVIDASNSHQGYVMVSQSGTDHRLKVQIVKDEVKYNYDLNNQGIYEAFPLQMGDGTYTIRIMQNKEGNSYFELYSATIEVTLDSEFSPFLVPNQYVNYDKTSKAVRKSFDLCSTVSTDVEKLAVLYQWMTAHVTYDKEEAETVQSGYLPVVDEVLETQKGICFDYAALLAAMLRVQGIPTKLVVGTVSEDDLNHAWNEVYLEEAGWITVKLAVDGDEWELVDATFGASQGDSVAQYIGDGTFYTSLKVY